MKALDFIKKNKGFVLGILLLFVARWSFADQYRVPSESMYPNIHIGDHIGVNKMAYDLKIPFTNISILKVSEPARGDVIVFIWPGDNSSNFVKRLIAVPGDRVKIRNGFVSVNGATLQSIYIEGNTSAAFYQEVSDDAQYIVQRELSYSKDESLEFIVPEDSYFFMGDNRDNSLDSRSWGFVKREALKGKANCILWNVTFQNLIPHFDFSRIVKALGS